MNDSISKKFHANDRILENLFDQMESLTSSMKNQLSFNKMLETQIAQLATALPNPTSGKLPGQPEQPSKGNVNAITTRGGKSTQDPPHPNRAGKAVPEEVPCQEEEQEAKEAPEAPEKEQPQRARNSTPSEAYH